jgi:hypothetical protein
LAAWVSYHVFVEMPNYELKNNAEDSSPLFE